MRRTLITLLLLPAGVLAAMAMAEPDPVKGTLQQADAALQAGEADKALALLASMPEGGEDIAEAESLQCRVQFTLAHWDAAIRHANRLCGWMGKTQIRTCGWAERWAKTARGHVSDCVLSW